MIECVKIEDVLTCIIFQVAGKDLTCGELKEIIENLPTIKIEEDTFEYLSEKSYNASLDDVIGAIRAVDAIDMIYPIGSYYFNPYNPAINPNDIFNDMTWEDCGGYWVRIK